MITLSLLAALLSSPTYVHGADGPWTETVVDREVWGWAVCTGDVCTTCDTDANCEQLFGEEP